MSRLPDFPDLSLISVISGEVLVFPITRDYGDVGDPGDL